MEFTCCSEYFLSRALAASLAGRAESFAFWAILRSLRISAAEVVFFFVGTTL